MKRLFVCLLLVGVMGCGESLQAQEREQARDQTAGQTKQAAKNDTTSTAEIVDTIFRFQAKDGTPLEAKLTIPAKGTAPFPVVFFLHGAGARTYDNPLPFVIGRENPTAGR